jgi:hypothetical protein
MCPAGFKQQLVDLKGNAGTILACVPG